MAMAAALAKVLRGGRSGRFSQAPIPAICRRGLQEGVAPHLPHAGSSPATPAAGMGRLIHTGQLQKFSLPPLCRPRNKRDICNLIRVSDDLKGLKQKYMRVPGYEVYGSEFSMLHISDQMNAVHKWMEAYERSWPWPAAISVLLIITAACAVDGYIQHKRNEKTLANIKAGLKKAATGVKKTKIILQELESQISHEEGA